MLNLPQLSRPYVVLTALLLVGCDVPTSATGYVRTPEGAPLKANVELVDQSGRIRASQLTQANGGYQVTYVHGNPSARATLRVSSVGFKPALITFKASLRWCEAVLVPSGSSVDSSITCRAFSNTDRHP